MTTGRITQLTVNAQTARAKLDSMQKPRLVKPEKAQQQPQQQPKEKKPSPDREYLQRLRDSGETARIVLMNGTAMDATLIWIDQYTLGVVGKDQRFFWLPKHSILFISTKGGNDDGTDNDV